MVFKSEDLIVCKRQEVSLLDNREFNSYKIKMVCYDFISID